MRFALCDDDQLYTRMIELMLTDLGHTVEGVAGSTADAVGLISAARPDVVILDFSMGFNDDFDVIEAAAAVGATAIVFSHNADEMLLGAYEKHPLIVHKPDLTELERVIGRLAEESGEVSAPRGERRQRPIRASSGRKPTGVGDAQAFYEALNDARPGDALLSIEYPSTDASRRDTSGVAGRVREVMRDTDRLVASPWSIRVFLPGGDELGVRSAESRLRMAGALPEGATVRAVVVGEDESPVAAFDRLKGMGQGT